MKCKRNFNNYKTIPSIHKSQILKPTLRYIIEPINTKKATVQTQSPYSKMDYNTSVISLPVIEKLAGTNLYAKQHNLRTLLWPTPLPKKRTLQDAFRILEKQKSGLGISLKYYSKCDELYKKYFKELVRRRSITMKKINIKRNIFHNQMENFKSFICISTIKLKKS